jgi:heme/copper-type cytochrome/quinol oxidase subunit 2
MIYSMIKHRKSSGHQPARFTGPTGTLQWFWALVPFAILLFIDFVLMGIPAFHAVIDMEDTRTKADMVLKVTGMQWKWQYEYPDSRHQVHQHHVHAARSDRANKEAKGEHYLLEVDNPKSSCRWARRCAFCSPLPTSSTPGGCRSLVSSATPFPASCARPGCKIEEPGTVSRPVRRAVRQGPRLHAGGRACRAGAEYPPGSTRRRPNWLPPPPASDRTWSKDELMASRQGRV